MKAKVSCCNSCCQQVAQEGLSPGDVSPKLQDLLLSHTQALTQTAVNSNVTLLTQGSTNFNDFKATTEETLIAGPHGSASSKVLKSKLAEQLNLVSACYVLGVPTCQMYRGRFGEMRHGLPGSSPSSPRHCGRRRGRPRHCGRRRRRGSSPSFSYLI